MLDQEEDEVVLDDPLEQALLQEERRIQREQMRDQLVEEVSERVADRVLDTMEKMEQRIEELEGKSDALHEAHQVLGRDLTKMYHHLGRVREDVGDVSALASEVQKLATGRFETQSFGAIPMSEQVQKKGVDMKKIGIGVGVFAAGALTGVAVTKVLDKRAQTKAALAAATAK